MGCWPCGLLRGATGPLRLEPPFEGSRGVGVQRQPVDTRTGAHTSRGTPVQLPTTTLVSDCASTRLGDPTGEISQTR